MRSARLALNLPARNAADLRIAGLDQTKGDVVALETATPSDNSAQLQGQKISVFIAQSRGNPQAIIDGRHWLREEIADKMKLARGQAEIAEKCAKVGDDVGMVHALRVLAAYVRFAGALGAELLTAKEALAGLRQAIGR